MSEQGGPMGEHERHVRDIMIDVFEYPHVPYWFTLRQVSSIFRKLLSGGKCLRPLVVLVFDEKYNLVGHISVYHILRGIETVLSPANDGKPQVSRSPDLQTMDAFRELSEKPASTLMHPSRFFVDPDDSISKAAQIMMLNNLEFLPVLENQKKLVGIVRPLEIFEELTGVFFRT